MALFSDIINKLRRAPLGSPVHNSLYGVVGGTRYNRAVLFEYGTEFGEPAANVDIHQWLAGKGYENYILAGYKSAGAGVFATMNSVDSVSADDSTTVASAGQIIQGNVMPVISHTTSLNFYVLIWVLA